MTLSICIKKWLKGMFYIIDVAGTNDSLLKINTNGVMESGDNTDNNDNVIKENVITKMSLTKMQTRCSQTNFTTKVESCTSPENPRYYREMRKSPKVKFTKGIKSTDYLTGTDNIFLDPGHIIERRCRSPSPVNRSFGFKIKGDDGNITKCVEWSSTRIELSDFHSPFLIPLHLPSTTESKLTDSGSEFYESYCCSSAKQNLHLTNSSINTSDSHCKGLLCRQGIMDQQLSPSKLLRSNLSCGGVQIHSYKEKQVSEDIVFQGEWQQLNPKTREKLKKNLTEISNKKRKIVSTDKLYLKKVEQKLEVKTETKKPTQVRNRTFKSKQEAGSKTEQMKKIDLPKTVVRTIRNKNVLKVSVLFYYLL